MNEKKMGIGVRVMVLKDRKVLLGKRRFDLNKAGSALHGGGTWAMPGGQVDFGENLEEALVREVYEETGANIDKKDLRLISVSHDLVNNVQFVALGFITDKLDDDPQPMKSGDVVEWQWFELDHLPENLYFNSASKLNNYLSDKIY